MATEQEVREGRQARRILEDDVFQKAMRMADEDTVQQWRQAETVEEREQAHAQQAALGIVEKQLRALKSRVEWEEES